MTKAQTTKYRKLLQDSGIRIQVTAESAEEQARLTIGGDDAGDLSKTPYHLGDLGSEAYAQELGATLLQNEQYLQTEILAALDRVEKGTFGKCEGCNKAIAAARLDAVPYARYCVKCAQREEGAKAVNLNEGRPANWSQGMGLRQVGPPAGVPGGPEDETVEDKHAAGTPGGGTAVGGLAGTNIGTGEPTDADLEAAAGSSAFDIAIESETDSTADMGEEGEGAQGFAGLSGGSVGGTPANKRAAGGRRK